MNPEERIAIDRQDPTGVLAESRHTGRTVAQLRAETGAGNAGDSGECLPAETILRLHDGSGLDGEAMAHLADCPLCGALRAAMEVDENHVSKFREELRRRAPLEPARPTSQPSMWRAKAALFASTCMVALSLGIHGMSYVKGQPITTGPALNQQLEIAVQGPNDEKPTTRVIAIQGTEINIRATAPQAASAVVLSKSDLQFPNSDPVEVSAAKQRVDAVIDSWLLLNNQVGNKALMLSIPPDLQKAQYITVANRQGETGFEVKFRGDVIAFVPVRALKAGLEMKTDILKVSEEQAAKSVKLYGELKLGDGSVVRYSTVN